MDPKSFTRPVCNQTSVALTLRQGKGCISTNRRANGFVQAPGEALKQITELCYTGEGRTIERSKQETRVEGGGSQDLPVKCKLPSAQRAL